MTPDPQFPNRPTHPDFELLSEVIHKLDDPDKKIEDQLSFIDEESMLYFVEQRMGVLTEIAKKHNVSGPEFLCALYLEGMTLGYHLSQARREAGS